MGKFDHERTLFSRALEIMVYVRKIIPFYGRKIQVSEILQFTWFSQLWTSICDLPAMLGNLTHSMQAVVPPSFFLVGGVTNH